MRLGEGLTLGIAVSKFQFTHPGKGATSEHYPRYSDQPFQFTHPGKGATPFVIASELPTVFQFTHPGKGATRLQPPLAFAELVSIHAPWEGCDDHTPHQRTRALAFQFTHPGKGATSQAISHTSTTTCFNSRTLGRVRHEVVHFGYTSLMFQFTHPGKGATIIIMLLPADKLFQFTHPGKGATLSVE